MTISSYFESAHRRVIAGFAIAFLAVCVLVSCNRQPQVVYADGGAQVVQPQVVQAAPTTIVQPVAVGGGYGGGDGFFPGLLAGHLMSGGSRSTHTVEHVYHQPAAAAPAAVAPAQRAAPIYRPAPTVTSNSRGITTVNRSTSVSRSISVGRRR